ncbi:MAG: hypothetical protein H7Y38_14535 [Armatimonadetes bacterium]|nr:hypothetical protein [Armatimonadota bacterium]
MEDKPERMTITATAHWGEPTSVQNAPVTHPKPDRVYGNLSLYGLENGRYVVDEREVGIITACEYTLQREGTREGTFQRIVLAWNACEGVANEELEPGYVASLKARIADAEAENATLRTALAKVMGDTDTKICGVYGELYVCRFCDVQYEYDAENEPHGIPFCPSPDCPAHIARAAKKKVKETK